MNKVSRIWCFGIPDWFIDLVMKTKEENVKSFTHNDYGLVDTIYKATITYGEVEKREYVSIMFVIIRRNSGFGKELEHEITTQWGLCKGPGAESWKKTYGD